MTNTFVIFADGSCKPATLTGGWAFVVYQNGREIYSDSGAETGITNNGFEVLAVLKALTWLDDKDQNTGAVIRTDSRHVVEGCQRWRSIWRGNGWKRINANSRVRKRPIPDKKLWQEVDRLLLSNPEIIIEWCKGHSGLDGNDQADALARARMSAPNVDS